MTFVKSYFNIKANDYLKLSEKSIWKYLREREKRAVKKLLPEASEGIKVLDIGCGAGYYSEFLYSLGFRDISCIDFSDQMLNQIPSDRFQKICADIEEFEFKEKYDLLLCAGTLEFLKDINTFFKKAQSGLKMNGSIILLIPKNNFYGLFYKLFHQSHGISVTLFKIDDILQLAENAGLHCSNSIGVFPFTYVLRMYAK